LNNLTRTAAAHLHGGVYTFGKSNYPNAQLPDCGSRRPHLFAEKPRGGDDLLLGVRCPRATRCCGGSRSRHRRSDRRGALRIVAPILSGFAATAFGGKCASTSRVRRAAPLPAARFRTRDGQRCWMRVKAASLTDLVGQRGGSVRSERAPDHQHWPRYLRLAGRYQEVVQVASGILDAGCSWPDTSDRQQPGARK